MLGKNLYNTNRSLLINSGLLVEFDPSHSQSTDALFNVAAAFVYLESRLLSSIQEAVHSSLASFKSSFDSEIRVQIWFRTDYNIRKQCIWQSSNYSSPQCNIVCTWYVSNHIHCSFNVTRRKEMIKTMVFLKLLLISHRKERSMTQELVATMFN